MNKSELRNVKMNKRELRLELAQGGLLIIPDISYICSYGQDTSKDADHEFFVSLSNGQNYYITCDAYMEIDSTMETDYELQKLGGL